MVLKVKYLLTSYNPEIKLNTETNYEQNEKNHKILKFLKTYLLIVVRY